MSHRTVKIFFRIWAIWMFVSFLFLLMSGGGNDNTPTPVIESTGQNEISLWEDNLVEDLPVEEQIQTWNIISTWEDPWLTGIDLATEEDVLTWVENATSTTDSSNSQEFGTWKDEIWVLMPRFFFNKWRQNFAINFAEKKDIKIKYYLIDDWSEYKSIVNGGRFTGGQIDMYLAPTNWINSISYNAKSIDFGEDLGPYFDSLFANVVDQQYTFVPFAIDPMVTMTLKWTKLSAQDITVSDLFSYMMLWTQDKSRSIPIAWGLSKNDMRLLKRWGESYPNFFDILYNLTYQLKTANKLKEFKLLMDLVWSQSTYSRDFVEFKQLYTTLAKREPDCDLFPGICLFAYKFADVKPWYLSDKLIWQTYFDDSSRDMGTVWVYNFPTYTESYKVRWRGFVPFYDTTKDEQIKSFVYQYIKSSLSNKYDLRPDMLSAHNSVLNIQRIQGKYKDILEYEHTYDLMIGGQEDQVNFLNQTNILDVFEWNESADKFWIKFKWDW